MPVVAAPPEDGSSDNSGEERSECKHETHENTDAVPQCVHSNRKEVHKAGQKTERWNMDTSQWLQEIYMEELGSTLPEHP